MRYGRAFLMSNQDLQMKITVKPSNRDPSYFHVYLDGKRFCGSRTPFFTAARKLLKIDTSPNEPLEMYHEGKDYLALKSTVGYAAKWTIRENAWVGPIRVPYTAPRIGNKATT